MEVESCVLVRFGVRDAKATEKIAKEESRLAFYH